MIVKSFEGETLEQALSLVKESLGDDALVLSTEQKKAGFLKKACFKVTAAKGVSEKKKEKPTVTYEDLEKVFPHRRAVLAPQKKEAQKELPEAAPRKVKKKKSGRSQEFEDMFLRMGFQSSSARELSNRLITEFPKKDLTVPSLFYKARRSLLASSLKAVTPEYLLTSPCWVGVGSAGAGKTSALVKLALKLKEMKARVHLSSRDHRKVFGLGELAAYAKLIGVPFQRPTESGQSIHLVDTPALDGKEAGPDGSEGETILILDATQRLSEIAHLIHSCKDRRPRAVVLTKVDLVRGRGAIFDMLREAKLPLLAASCGSSFRTPIQFFDSGTLASFILRSDS